VSSQFSHSGRTISCSTSFFQRAPVAPSHPCGLAIEGLSFFFSLVYGYEKSNFISSYKLLNPLEVHISEEKKEKHETTNQPKFVMEQKCCHQAHASSTQTQGSTHPSSMFHHGTLTRRSMQPMRNI